MSLKILFTIFVIGTLSKLSNSKTEPSQIHTSTYDLLKNDTEKYGEQIISVPKDATLLVPEIVQKYGYPCESHTVVTVDGYILTMHRIPRGRYDHSNRYRPAVFLQHGILSSSADWLLAGPQKSLGYILADAGYDVWMGNARGNRYSRKHINLNPNGKKFWEFSWHEIGVYDVPALIDYILYQRNLNSLYYIGHSQGTTVFYVMCSEKPQYNKKIKLHMSLAATAYMDHIVGSLLQTLAYFELEISILSQTTGIYEILPTSTIFSMAVQEFCNDYIVTQTICVDILFSIFGYNPKQINATLLPIVAGHTPAGASLKQLLHYGQLITSGTFRKWDAGFIQNIALYGSFYPPDYKVERITAPIYIYFSRNDFLSREIDVNRLISRLPNVKRKILIADPEFNHIDYLYAKEAPQLLYSLLINAMNAFQ